MDSAGRCTPKSSSPGECSQHQTLVKYRMIATSYITASSSSKTDGRADAKLLYIALLPMISNQVDASIWECRSMVWATGAWSRMRSALPAAQPKAAASAGSPSTNPTSSSGPSQTLRMPSSLPPCRWSPRHCYIHPCD